MNPDMALDKSSGLYVTMAPMAAQISMAQEAAWPSVIKMVSSGSPEPWYQHGLQRYQELQTLKQTLDVIVPQGQTRSLAAALVQLTP